LPRPAPFLMIVGCVVLDSAGRTSQARVIANDFSVVGPVQLVKTVAAKTDLALRKYDLLPVVDFHCLTALRALATET